MSVMGVRGGQRLDESGSASSLHDAGFVTSPC